MKNQLSTTDYAAFFAKGISYEQYFDDMTNAVAQNIERPHAEYIPINWQRSKRISKTLQLQASITEALEGLQEKFYWLVISEHWCGDASQILPVMAGIAAASDGKIVLRVLYRDENPELMAAHLTNNAMAIPKLLQLDTNYRLLNTWGPRPAEAQQLVMALKANPETKNTYAEKVQKWYADNKTIAIQQELAEQLTFADNFLSNQHSTLK